MSFFSRYKCYCGFETVVKYKMPTTMTKAWLESDCLSCGARYDIRIYPHENSSMVNVHKRLLKTSPQVDAAIARDATIPIKKNGVQNGETGKKENQSH